jgi:DNA-binding HxlR family transcriptional regulator
VDGIEVMCPRYHYAVELIGARWSGAILRALLGERRRYADIKAAIPGLSDTMLARRLRELEGEGLLQRDVVPASPVRVEYGLTEKGLALAPVIEAVVRWADAWVPAPVEAAAPGRPSARARRAG